MKKSFEYYREVTADGFIWIREELALLELRQAWLNEEIAGLEKFLSREIAKEEREGLEGAVAEYYKLTAIRHLQAKKKLKADLYKQKVSLFKRLGYVFESEAKAPEPPTAEQ